MLAKNPETSANVNVEANKLQRTRTSSETTSYGSEAAGYPTSQPRLFNSKNLHDIPEIYGHGVAFLWMSEQSWHDSIALKDKNWQLGCVSFVPKSINMSFPVIPQLRGTKKLRPTPEIAGPAK